MKKILLLLCGLCSVMLFGQAYRMPIENKEKIAQLNPDGLVFLVKIEEVLANNHEKLKNKKEEIQNPAIGELFKQGLRNSPTSIKKQVENNVCLSCYEAEWADQLLEVNLIRAKKNYNRDSLYQKSLTFSREAIQILGKNVVENKNPKAKQSGSTEVEGYAKLERQLGALSRVEDFTLFRKLDYNFVVSRFGVYLQLTKRMTYLGQEKKGNKIIDKYTPGISIKKDEYLYVTYTVEEHPDLRGAFGDGLTEIKEVEITGDPELVIQLFASYWSPLQVDLTRNTGYMVSIEKMSDYIQLQAVAPKQYKITITKGNMDVNYAATFGIHQKIEVK
ncbi:hypothetical protein [Myroides odoratus]|uniref:hypothetical protein n=1 Tax=Myroides odoratus TaxID=256 RepID=UPI0039AED18A